MDLHDLQWLFVILAIVATGFGVAVYLSVKYAREADRAWPEHEAVEVAEATISTHH